MLYLKKFTAEVAESAEARAFRRLGCSPAMALTCLRGKNIEKDLDRKVCHGYVPIVGSPTPNFQVSYNAAQFRELSQGQAILVIGDGAISGAPNPAVLNGPGSLQGHLTLHLSSGINVTRAFTFGLETQAGKWEKVIYPDGVGGLLPPHIGGELTVLQQYLLSLLPDPAAPHPNQLRFFDDFHVAAVVRIAENATTVNAAPLTIAVDLVSYDSAGVEIDRLEDIIVERLLNDGEPNSIVYHNDLAKPGEHPLDRDQ